MGCAGRINGDHPALLTMQTLSDSDLDDLAQHWVKVLPADDPNVGAARNAQRDRLTASGDQADWVAAFNLGIMTATTEKLPSEIRRFFDEHPDMPRTLHVVWHHPELAIRYTLVRLLATARTVSGLHNALSGNGFPAAQALTWGGIFGPGFLAPALLISAPWVQATMAPRAGALLIWPFNTSVYGARWPSNRLLDNVSPQNSRFCESSPATAPAHSAAQYAAFLTWWVDAVNRLLAVATDPARFPEPGTRTYSPDRQTQFLMSLERLFRDVAEVLRHAGRDHTARLRAAYDALDTLEGLQWPKFRDFTTPSQARKYLDEIAAKLPADVAAVLVPACRVGVDALDQVKDGFYDTGPLWTPAGLDGVPEARQPTQPWDVVVPNYLRIDRNSAHSFSDLAKDERAIFLAHRGELPTGLASLALLGLTHFLAHPERLEPKLGR
ncbi:hypothetical protein [Streptodolium elevatio]|uniref:Uncharacterized protein n=1 Tax=Streptodolium elevatio TaxID=3157996 RepID=A0ABV3DL91_9ACTN